MSFAPIGGGKGGGQKKGSMGRSTAAGSDDTDEPAARADGAGVGAGSGPVEKQCAGGDGAGAGGEQPPAAARLVARDGGAGVAGSGPAEKQCAGGDGARAWALVRKLSAAPIAAYSETKSSKTVLLEEMQSGLVGVRVGVKGEW